MPPPHPPPAPPPPASTGRTLLTRAKTAMVLLCTAMALVFLLYTGYMRVKNSSAKFLIAMSNFIILFLVFHNRRNPDDQKPHPPLFSFLSLSRQPRYSHHLDVNGHVGLPLEPAVSLPSVAPQHLETDAVYDCRVTAAAAAADDDDIVLERGESLETILSEYQELPEVSTFADDRASHDQGSDGDMDETWNAIVARGQAKPVRLFTSNQREANLKPDTKKPKTRKRKEKKKATDQSSSSSSSSYNKSGDRISDGGWRKEAATGISGEELSHLSEMFIRRQRNHHRIERQESDQRRLVDRLRFRNPVSAV